MSYNRRSHAPRGAYPTMYAGLRAWLDASLLLGSDGSAVTTWPDQVAGLYDAVSVGDSNRDPILKLAQKNGLNVLRFEAPDAANTDVLYVPHELVDGLSECSIFAVFRRNGDTAAGEANLLGGYTGAARQFRLYFPNGADPALTYVFGGVGTDVSAVSNTALFDPSGWTVLAGTAKNDEAIRLWINGTEPAYATQDNAVTLTSPLGGDLGIGVRIEGGGGIGLDVDYAELLVYESQLSDGEVAGVHAYLNRKWGLGL